MKQVNPHSNSHRAESPAGGAAMGDHAVLEVPDKPAMPQPGQAVHVPGDREKPARMVDCITVQLYAAIDLGSSNCRLLVARPCNDGFKVIDAFSRVVRLGEGVREKGYLCEAAMERAIDALRVCAKKLRRHPGARLRAVATEACRTANNREEFVRRVFDETGITLDIINPDEESRLALQACSALLDERPYAVVFDIGGGSTEICWIKVDKTGKTQCIETLSMPCGVLCLTERYASVEERRERFEAMRTEIRERLEEFAKRNCCTDMLDDDKVQMVGTSGTVTTFCGIALGLERYERHKVDGSDLRFDDAERVTELLLRMESDKRKGHPCIGNQRAELMDAGAAIFAAIRDIWPLATLKVADRGLREGILVDLMRADGHAIDPCDARRHTVSHIPASS
ncbi:Ppx/GppA family phosphatase [Thalassospira sp. GO-4]|uniref:Ppx/GppA phosphatase family protein n=1 Tax=Thalassospira sp. GO-4 TaxID=2946605 RepID=UPI0020243D61|nr:Ppx/GppA phosphatase family protein [Thalassospira sp. GO-4]URK18004.1 Ppx/GppA family phosphatase [Thalassospira sp. GO-4]